MFIGISPAGIDFLAPDGQPAEIICLLLTPAGDQRGRVELFRIVAESYSTRAARRTVVEAEGYTQFRAALTIADGQVDTH